MPASAATAVLIGQVAAATKAMRTGERVIEPGGIDAIAFGSASVIP